MCFISLHNSIQTCSLWSQTTQLSDRKNKTLSNKPCIQCSSETRRTHTHTRTDTHTHTHTHTQTHTHTYTHTYISYSGYVHVHIERETYALTPKIYWELSNPMI